MNDFEKHLLDDLLSKHTEDYRDLFRSFYSAYRDEAREVSNQLPDKLDGSLGSSLIAVLFYFMDCMNQYLEFSGKENSKLLLSVFQTAMSDIHLKLEQEYDSKHPKSKQSNPEHTKQP